MHSLMQPEVAGRYLRVTYCEGCGRGKRGNARNPAGRIPSNWEFPNATLDRRVHWICSWPAAPTDVYRVSRSGNLGEKETQDQAGSLTGLRPLAVHRLLLFLICYIPRCVLCSNTRRCCFLCDSTLVSPPPLPFFFNQAVSM
jgi:hypothetical protein